MRSGTRSHAPPAGSPRRCISRWVRRFQHWTEDLNIKGKAYRTIWLAADGWSVEIIDQTRLPHELVVAPLRSVEDAGHAIKTMQVRGAPLIGAAAAYGVCLALRVDASDEALDNATAFLAAQRPTAVNLRWALDEMGHAVRNLPREAR